MIRYRLACDKGHAFDAWFASGEAYDKLARRKRVVCETCGSTKVEKALMAPSVRPSDREAPRPGAAEPPPSAAPVAMMPAPTPEQGALIEQMRALRDAVKKQGEYVGKRFPEEARKIHHEESPARGIYGEASPEEAKALIEEGIEILPLPVLPEAQN